jgi:hypothetical protein
MQLHLTLTDMLDGSQENKYEYLWFRQQILSYNYTAGVVELDNRSINYLIWLGSKSHILLLFVCFPGVTTHYGCIFTAR